jgi:UPF0271 protein
VKRIDLNVDVGEGFLFDEELLKVATSANVCCGAHAGSVELCLATVDRCRSLGLRVGAHPGVPDRENMGRAPLVFESEDQRVALLQSLLEQCAVAQWDYVKPHGALYNATTSLGPATVPMVAFLLQTKLPLLGMPGSHHEDIAFAAEVAFVREGFADRAYTPQGVLVPRSAPGAVLTDPSQIAAQIQVLAERVDSICVHGDIPGCVEIAILVRSKLESCGYEVGA